jgi:hypothetical protein
MPWALGAGSGGYRRRSSTTALCSASATALSKPSRLCTSGGDVPSQRWTYYGTPRRDSEVLVAVRNATPESRREFEKRFGPISFTEYVIGSPENGGWVEAKILTEDGKVLRVRYEGDSEDAERVREGLRAGRLPRFPRSCRVPGRGPVGGRACRRPLRTLGSGPSVDGGGIETSGILIDWRGLGAVLNLAGGWLLVAGACSVRACK